MVEQKDVRAKLIEGPKSIVKNLPTPDVKVFTLPQKNNCAYAHINVNALLNHMLAYNGRECYYYRAGYEEDWDPNKYENDPKRRKFLSSKFAKDLHDWVKKLVEDGTIVEETRIVVYGFWSDAFSARAITANNEFNSIQTFTVRLRGKKDFILPNCLLFKKNNSRWLIVELLKELLELKQSTDRYWSSEKRIIPTIAVMDAISNDYIERVVNTGTCQNGTFSKRWGYSCCYEDEVIPTCMSCIQKRNAQSA